MDPQAGWPGRNINMQHFGRLSMVLLLKDPVELFVRRREFFPDSGFLSLRDVTSAFKSDIKPGHTSLPFSGYKTKELEQG